MHDVTIICDSWTGPTGMSIMNFMVYCNSYMTHLDVDFVYKVRIMLPKCFVVMYVKLLLTVCTH
jgi:hypothetical protein